MTSGTREQPGRARDLAIAALIALLFLFLRTALFHARDPFFDELFSVWMARQPFGALLSNLEVDSGPPLYYLFARLPGVPMLRLLSLLFAALPVAVLLRQKRWIAALLLAVHPAAALFAVTARPYALCATFLAIGILFVERDRVWPAAAAFVAASYTHYLGVLFLPTLFFCRAPLRRRILAMAAAGMGFVPAFLLSLAQPAEATAWMTRPDLQAVLATVAFLSDQPAVAIIFTAAAAALTLVAASRSWRHAPFVLVPLALVVALSFVRPALYGVRFASLLAFPLALWIEESALVWAKAGRVFLVGLLAAVGTSAIALDVMTNLQAPIDDYRAAAIVLRQHATGADTIVATGYLYLETVHQLPDRRVTAFPAEQAIHPGWRTSLSRDLSGERLPHDSFVWIGEKAAPELAAIRRGRRTRVLYANPRAAILRVW